MTGAAQMIFESWSIALITCSAITLILGLVGAVSAVRVILSWDSGSDAESQILLEEQVWLAATLTQFGFVVQVVSALIFIYAAGYFATILKGAMCAAGSLTANGYGLAALAVKIVTIFLGALWIIVHRLDIRCEDLPLTRFKSFWLLCLLPLLCIDAFLVISYLINLDPEIITSCCGVLFSDTDDGGYSLFDYASPGRLVWFAAINGGVVVVCSLWISVSLNRPGTSVLLVGSIAIAAWISLYLLAILIITVIVSPYVYALPHHRCPFDLFHYPYAVIGVPLYLFLHVAVLFGLGGAVAVILTNRWLMVDRVRSFIKIAAMIAVVSLFLFIICAAWPPVSYVLLGGQK